MGASKPAERAGAQKHKANHQQVLLMLSNAENRIVLQVQALESCVTCDQEFHCGDHPGMGDEVEEPSDVLLKENKVVSGVVLLKNLPNVSEKR